MSQIKPIRGMPDILPDQTPVWQYVERCVEQVLSAYAYNEIRLPVLERTQLFKRSIGEVTDIVEKEMYTFEDRNGESMTLRPEGTASCVRAAMQHGLIDGQPQRLWYCGPMFRYERPQKGRQRQFHQIGVEAFALDGPDIDAELILLCARLWKRLGISQNVVLQLNSLGTSDDRSAYRQALVEFLGSFREQLDEDSQRRLETNPLRILDSKSPQTQEVLQNAPALSDFLGDEARAHFEGLCKILDEAGVTYEINPSLVRGLDYYSKTVFEWVTDDLGAQGTVCAGGRYDGLVEQLGGRATPAAGFALGLERLLLLLASSGSEAGSRANADVYIAWTGEAEQRRAAALGELLRDRFGDARLIVHCGAASLKSQMKKADRSGAMAAIIIGAEELAANEVSLRYMRGDNAGEQQRVDVSTLEVELSRVLSQTA